MHRLAVKSLVLLLVTAGPAFAGQSGESASFSGACLLLKVDESLAYGPSVIEWGQALYDHGGWSNLDANPTRLTVPSGVSYVVVNMGGEVDKVAGQFNIRDDINGSDSLTIQTVQQSADSGYGGHVTLTATTPALPVNAGDYFEYVAGSSGAATLRQASETYFCIRAVQ